MSDKNPIYGLVVCGGNSSRMGVDKCFLDYHSQPQWEYISQLLYPFFCDKVFVSCSAKQTRYFPKGTDLIVDDPEYAGCGPISGLLSAFKEHNHATFLVIGCDYPFLNSMDLEKIVFASSRGPVAAAYNKLYDTFDPLLAIYKAETAGLLFQMFARQKYSLRSFLNAAGAEKILLPYESMQSTDTAQEFLAVKQLIDDEKIVIDQLSHILL